MIHSYGLTRTGFSHIEEGSICQDAHKIRKVSESVWIAAVADGVGSHENSDMASDIAVSVSVDYCSARITEKKKDEEILNIIKCSFYEALNAVKDTAKEKGLDPYFDCGTTLTLAVYIRSVLYYGHSGDGGIIALSANGNYIQITKPQNDEQRRVFTLQTGDRYWVFGKTDSVVSLLLATDGIYFTFFPDLLNFDSEDSSRIWINRADYFLNNKRVQIGKKGTEAIKKKIEAEFEDPDKRLTDDDATVVVMINPDIRVTLRPDEYYAEPDWEALREKYRLMREVSEEDTAEYSPDKHDDQSKDDPHSKKSGSERSSSERPNEISKDRDQTYEHKRSLLKRLLGKKPPAGDPKSAAVPKEHPGKGTTAPSGKIKDRDV